MSEKKYEKKTGLKVASVFLMVLGYGGSTLFGGGLLLLLAGSAVAGQIGVGFVVGILPMILLGGSLFAAIKGTTIYNGLTRFQRYIKIIGSNDYCNIDQLAENVGKSAKFVVKDVEKMMKKGWFCCSFLASSW